MYPTTYLTFTFIKKCLCFGYKKNFLKCTQKLNTI